MARYVFDPAHGLGLGQHHADGDLATRPAQPPEAAAALMGALEMVNPTEEQRDALAEFTSRTMADLDMDQGTEVEVLERDEDRDLERVSWTDRHGNDRITSVTPAYFAEHFVEVGK